MSCNCNTHSNVELSKLSLLDKTNKPIVRKRKQTILWNQKIKLFFKQIVTFV
jgi:hypothetical protein